MSETRRINKGIEEGVHDLLVHLLESGTVQGVFSLMKTNEEGGVDYSLITDVEHIQNAVPFQPLMPVNAGRALSLFTLDGPAPKPIAAVLRPCELRAFIELVKRAQGSLENFLLISLTCGGVYPLKSLARGTFGSDSAEYWSSVEKSEIPEGIRLTCRSCVDFVPLQADIVFAAVGAENIEKECLMLLPTENGRKIAGDLPGAQGGGKYDEGRTGDLKKKRLEEKDRLFKDFDANRKGQAEMIKTFTPCLGCHACGEVCPICSCLLCTFDSKTSDYNPENIDFDLNHKGGLKVPTGNLFYHLGRMSHMAVSCVGCGMCSDVCPVNIPVATVFTRVGDSLQKVFEYQPGLDVEQPVPSGTFKEDEFAQAGEQ